MTSLAACTRNIAVTCGTRALILDIKSGACNSVLEPPNLSGQSADKVIDNGSEESRQEDSSVGTSLAETQCPAAIELASFSFCNTWLVLCSNNKQLSLWKTSDWSLVSNRSIVRTASAVKFTTDCNFIVVADKSGDAYTFSVKNPLEKGTLILGHLSMLMDILVTSNGKYVITCDRDEKIRVSNFPNSYNIMTYCLGHEQFVSKIDFLPHNIAILISSSGDGTIRFWNYESGKPIHMINCWQDLKMMGSGSMEVLPVKRFTSCMLSDKASVICAMLAGSCKCIVYQVFQEQTQAIEVKSEQLQIISFDVEPWDLTLTEDKLLWVLSPLQKEIIRVYTLDKHSKQYNFNPDALSKETSLAVAFVQEKCEWFSSISPPNSLSVFYKRKYDNLLVYHERKKMRTMASSSATAVTSSQ